MLRFKSKLIVAAASCLIALGIGSAMAENDGQSNVASPNASYQGMSYAQWSAAWAQWVYSLPSTHHPLFDNADCSVGQRGNVWFLDGVMEPPNYPVKLGRDCTVPAGTSLFLALLVATRDNTNCHGSIIDPTNLTEAQLRQSASDWVGTKLANRTVMIDGVTVHGLLTKDGASVDPNTRFRVKSPVYDYTVPSIDNLMDLTCYQELAADLLTVHGSISEGVYVMIKPFSVGFHTIEFGLRNTDGSPSKKYNITVTGTHGNGHH